MEPNRVDNSFTRTIFVILIILLVGSRSSLDFGKVPDYFVLIGFVLAGLGLDTWRTQLKGTSRYQVASDLLLETYRVREAIQVVRSPFIEYVPASYDHKSSEMNDFLGYVKTLDKRWEQLLEPTAQLSLVALKAEVHLGNDVKSAVDLLLRLVRELQIAYQMHIDMKKPGSGFHDDPFYVENQKVLWAKPSNDNFKARVSNSIAEIEKFSRSFLK